MNRLGRLRPPTGDVRQDAISELRWTMAGEGLTADKLAVLPAVLDLPVVRAALAGVPVEHRPAAAFRSVVAATRALGGSVDARLLRTALGVDYDGDARNLTERRAAFGWVGDPRTLYERERKMLEALVTVLGAPPVPAEPGGLDVSFQLAGRAVRSVEHACETQRVRYDIEYGDGPEPLCAVRLACPVTLLTVRVTFDPAALPELAWRLGGQSPAERLGLDGTGRVVATFERPAVSRPYGVAWAWRALPRVVRVSDVPAARVGV